MALIQVSLGLTVAECATRVGVSTQTIQDYIREGRLDALAVGPRLFFVPTASFERFLEMRGLQ